MIDDLSNTRVPAPCIIDNGIVVNKSDMKRILTDLGHVRYTHSQDGQVQSQGEGYIIEVFADSHQSTLIANQSIYLNVCSFDYLQLGGGAQSETYIDLVQETRHLRLIPISSPLKEQNTPGLNSAALEAALAQVLCAKLDAQIDDDGSLQL